LKTGFAGKEPGFIPAEELMQNQDGVIPVKAVRLMASPAQALEMRSHEFH
jgi:hypothetical protein